MKIVVIDGQGGKMGKSIVEKIKEANICCELLVVGTNSIATSAMLKAGADNGATGENAVVVASKSADVIIGPIGIIVADALFGEITPTMAISVGQSRAKKFLLPVNLCNNIIVGTNNVSINHLITEVIDNLIKLN